MIEVNKIYNGDCLGVLKTFPDNSIDSCVTDPPYGISFMNKHWDYQIPSIEIWEQVLRVLKPGGHLLCACGTRTQHRMVCNIEDAGFEIRDVISWIYATGFPKSLDISKAIDKAAGVEREVIGKKTFPDGTETRVTAGKGIKFDIKGDSGLLTTPATDAAKQWEGWGTALKPATEFWTLARKPIEENTIAENVLKYGTGGLNIDGSRIGHNEEQKTTVRSGRNTDQLKGLVSEGLQFAGPDASGRFPANVIFDEFTGKILDEQSGVTESKSGGLGGNDPGMWAGKNKIDRGGHDDIGGASRFFYTPKADNFERNKGLNKMQAKMIEGRDDGQDERNVPYKLRPAQRTNIHPTVKPIDLMRYLVKLITPKHGICIDPFCGSGTTLIGCKLELIKYIGIDTNEEYCKIAEARVAAWNPERYIEQTLF